MSEKLADLGEFGLIAAITARLPQASGVIVGPGDDAAVLATADGRVVVTTDLLVENRHFRRDWSSADDIGHKAAAQNLADVAAMGAVPTGLVVGLGAPADLPAAWALGFADGLREECEPLGVSVVGGDVVRSDVVVVAMTALGDLQGRAPVTRAGARPGDVVAVCGRLGWAEAGFRVLSRGFRSPRVLVEAHRRPVVPYRAGPQAAELGATAMCDVSDGLLADLGHVAQASGGGRGHRQRCLRRARADPGCRSRHRCRAAGLDSYRRRRQRARGDVSGRGTSAGTVAGCRPGISRRRRDRRRRALRR